MSDQVAQSPISASDLGAPANAAAASIDGRLLHRLAEEVWRLGRRLDRAAADVGRAPLDGVHDALDRLIDLLDEAGVRAVDHDGERYVDGLLLDILHVEGDPPEGAPLRIVRTVRPSIVIRDRVAVGGQVILGPLTDATPQETPAS